MKIAGTILFAFGIIAIFYSVNMSATVHTPIIYSSSVSEVYNTGLLNDRTNYVIISCFATLIGAIWMVLGKGFKLKDAPASNYEDIDS